MGPSSSLVSGKMVSWWMMIVLMISLTWAWQETWSWLSGVGMSVGPKHMAKLYGSIMFSSLYWDRLENSKDNVPDGTNICQKNKERNKKNWTNSWVSLLTGWGRQRGSAWQWGLILGWSGGSCGCRALSRTNFQFLGKPNQATMELTFG